MSLFLQGENRNVACTSPLVHPTAAMPPSCTTRSNVKPSLAQHAHPTQHEAIAQDKASRPTPSHQGAPATRESSTAQLDPGTPSATQLWKVVQEQNRRALRVARSTLCSGSHVSGRHRPTCLSCLLVRGDRSDRPLLLILLKSFLALLILLSRLLPPSLLTYQLLTYLPPLGC